MTSRWKAFLHTTKKYWDGKDPYMPEPEIIFE